MSKSKQQKDTVMVTTGIRRKTVFLEVECPDLVACGKVLALLDHWVDVLKFGVERDG